MAVERDCLLLLSMFEAPAFSVSRKIQVHRMMRFARPLAHSLVFKPSVTMGWSAITNCLRRRVSSRNPAISNTSTISEVCEWAGRASTLGGVGLDDEDVSILRREKIKGVSLFKLTDVMLKEDGMPRGARRRCSYARATGWVQPATWRNFY